MPVEEKLWVEKYRPRTIEDCIIPERNKTILKAFVENKDIPNLIFASSTPGSGKTSTARAIASELGYDTLFINASLENGIDVLRDKITAFATTVSFTGNMKCVILDEADYTNPQSLQPALRGFIEQFSKSVRFIFTCNYINKLLPPIVSRCTVIDFNFSEATDNKNRLCMAMFKRVCTILENEGIEYDKTVVAKLISKHFPDWRRVINELQRYAASGRIDEGIFVSIGQNNFSALEKALKEKNFKNMRLWVGENKNVDYAKVFRHFYDRAFDLLVPQSVPQLILTTAEYQYKSAFVADQEINLAAYLTEIMSGCTFKE